MITETVEYVDGIAYRKAQLDMEASGFEEVSTRALQGPHGDDVRRWLKYLGLEAVGPGPWEHTLYALRREESA